MSDADDQMGGSGGETGRPPGGEPPTPASKRAAEAGPGDQDPEAPKPDDDQVNQDSEDSFPASDPPARY